MTVTDSIDRTVLALCDILSRTDQADWVARLTKLGSAAVGAPLETSKIILELFDDSCALPTSCTRNGVAYTEPESQAREDAFAFAALRWQLYQQALALFNETAPPPLEPDISPTRLVDYGGGCEIWFAQGGYLVRYDCGSHVSRWREDAISAVEARQGTWGATHFHKMILALQRRLEADGTDVYRGSSEPLPDIV